VQTKNSVEKRYDWLMGADMYMAACIILCEEMLLTFSSSFPVLNITKRIDKQVGFTSANPDQGYYNPVGSRILTPYSNSNNAFTYLMMNSGVSREQMNDISHTLASNNRWSAGLGMSLLSPTVIQNKAQNVFNSFSFSIQTLTKVLESYNSGLKNK